MRTKVKYLICKWGRFLNGLVMSALGLYTIRPPCFNIQAFKHRYINKTQSKYKDNLFTVLDWCPWVWSFCWMFLGQGRGARPEPPMCWGRSPRLGCRDLNCGFLRYSVPLEIVCPYPYRFPDLKTFPTVKRSNDKIIGSMCQYWFSSALWKSWHHFKKNWHNSLINMTQLIKPTLSLWMPLQRESKPKRVHNNAGTCHVYADSVTDHL